MEGVMALLETEEVEEFALDEVLEEAWVELREVVELQEVVDARLVEVWGSGDEELELEELELLEGGGLFVAPLLGSTTEEEVIYERVR